MSSIPGYTTEMFLMWNYDLIVQGQEEKASEANFSLALAELLGHQTRRITVSQECFDQLMALFEPYAEQIEDRLSDFDEENQSWRDYAGYAFDFIPDSVLAQGQAIANPAKKEGP